MKKKMQRKTKIFIEPTRPAVRWAGGLLLCLLTWCSEAQLVQLPLREAKSPQKSTRQARTAATLTPMPLPFWDDFSFTRPGDAHTPHDTLWTARESVWVNEGIGVNPPSRMSATFDGLDSLGNPYNVNDVLSKGYADKLVSRPIRLDLVPVNGRDSVFLSFYFQYKGNGEAPDPGDLLSLDLLDSAGNWVPTSFAPESFDTYDPTVFYPYIVQVADGRYFHDAFQFRFRNFARLSGQYDTWNLDYIYLNKGRYETDTSFPDRTVTTGLTSTFSTYRAIPIKHFDPSLIAKPSVVLNNLRAGNLQPFDYSTWLSVTATSGGTTLPTATRPLDVAQDPGFLLQPLQYKTLTLNQSVAASDLDLSADSIHLEIKLAISTKDNVVPANNGDYITSKYAPVDFRWNDTTRTAYDLSTYYAYDDGTAEYGAGLNQPGTQLAYRYDLLTPEIVTLKALDIYFPEFGDKSTQLLQFNVWQDLNETNTSLLYSQTMPVVRSTHNKMVRFVFSNYVQVQGTFYVGWKQSAAVVIPAGLDKSTDSSDKISFNTNGAWQSNVLVKGSLMLRPVFLEGVVTGLPEMSSEVPYPNPSSGVFYLPQGAHSVHAITLTGQAVAVESVDEGDRTAVRVNSEPGILVVRWMQQNKMRAARLMVQSR
ncbi:MAG: hypothetical protein K1X47_12630 [Cyclobacteriaceae bacterium]|nr:hypothetical protein [Cyclobacteriaceae bacterium]